jgi:hypothetical protein
MFRALKERQRKPNRKHQERHNKVRSIITRKEAFEKDNERWREMEKVVKRG